MNNIYIFFQTNKIKKNIKQKFYYKKERIYIYTYIKQNMKRKTKSSHTKNSPTIKISTSVNSPKKKKQISRWSRGRSMEILCKQIKVQTRSSTLVKFARKRYRTIYCLYCRCAYVSMYSFDV